MIQLNAFKLLLGLFCVFVLGGVAGIEFKAHQKPTLEIEKKTASSEAASSDLSMASGKKAEASEASTSTTKIRSYYPNGVLKREYDSSVETIKKHYEEEISTLKQQIVTLKTASTYEHIVVNSCPMNQLTAIGGFFGEKAAVYQRNLFKNVSLGGGGYQFESSAGVLGSASFSW